MDTASGHMAAKTWLIEASGCFSGKLVLNCFSCLLLFSARLLPSSIHSSEKLQTPSTVVDLMGARKPLLDGLGTRLVHTLTFDLFKTLTLSSQRWPPWGEQNWRGRVPGERHVWGRQLKIDGGDSDTLLFICARQPTKKTDFPDNYTLFSSHC